MTHIIITMIVPEALFDVANEYAAARGRSEADKETWTVAPYEKDEVRYGVLASPVRPEWLAGAGAKIERPEWGADVAKAGQAKGTIRLWSGTGKWPDIGPDAIVALAGVDAQEVLAHYKLKRIEAD